MRNLLILLVCIFINVTNTSAGAYRHDTPIEKYLELAAHDEFSGVGRTFRFRDKVWVPAGTCILIDSIHILTAAHTLIRELKKDTTVDYNGYKVKTYIVTGRLASDPSEFWFLVNNQYAKAKKIQIYPDYLKDNGKEAYDIALITLQKPIKSISIKLNRDLDELHDTVTGVGYGASAPGNTGELAQGYNIKLAGQNIIDSIGGIMRNNVPAIMYADFDSPDRSCACNKLGDNVALPFEYGPLGGDSGSPLFRERNGVLELVGILTGSDSSIPKNLKKTGYYGMINWWVRIAAFYDWIEANK